MIILPLSCRCLEFIHFFLSIGLVRHREVYWWCYYCYSQICKLFGCAGYIRFLHFYWAHEYEFKIIIYWLLLVQLLFLGFAIHYLVPYSLHYLISSTFLVLLGILGYYQATWFLLSYLLVLSLQLDHYYDYSCELFRINYCWCLYILANDSYCNYTYTH